MQSHFIYIIIQVAVIIPLANRTGYACSVVESTSRRIMLCVTYFTIDRRMKLSRCCCSIDDLNDTGNAFLYVTITVCTVAVLSP